MPGQLISIEKIKQGDVGVFQQLFHTYYARLCVYAERITGNDIAAEEIVSDMFLKLWEKREQLNIKSSVESYLISAVHHQSVNYLKHVKVEEKYWEAAQYQLRNIDLLNPYDASNPLSPLITEEITREIESAIDALPPQCREILRLNKFEELSYDEIAERLGVSVNTVRTQIVRAMRKLQISLGKYLSVIFLILVRSVLQLFEKYI